MTIDPDALTAIRDDAATLLRDLDRLIDRALKARAGIQATRFTSEDPTFDCPGHSVRDLIQGGEALVPHEVLGWAMVSRRFAVVVPQTDDIDVIEDFGTREEAEAFIADLNAWDGEAPADAE